jgi:glycosyltransferase involved in cell wall biosynthesis
MAKILYITYDGLMDPLGMSQVWQYVKVLSKKHTITIVSFEKSKNLFNQDKFNLLISDIESCGVSWYRLKYHKTPSTMATAYDIFFGIMLSIFIVKKYKIEVVHARSYVPSLIAFTVNKLLKIKFIFDMRGFWGDEKVDGGAWSKDSLIYRVTKKLERIFFLKSGFIVSLTNAGRYDILSLEYMKHQENKVTVIPTCVNLKLFKPQQFIKPINNGLNHPFILGYVGSVGTFYLFDEVLRSFQALLKIRKNSKLLIINKDQHNFLYKKISSAGINNQCVEIKSVEYGEVATEINRMDAGIFYIKPVFSKRSSSPTKFGEFLGCGKPCISNFGVGDTEYILEREGVGVVLKDFSNDAHANGIGKLLELIKGKDIEDRCVRIAEEYYSLEIGVEKYNSIYKQLADKKHLK